MANHFAKNLAANPQVAISLAQGMAQAATMSAQIQQTTSQFADWNPLTANCLRPATDGGDQEESEEHEYVVPVIEGQSKLRVRLCVYSGEQLPRERTYVVVVLGAGGDEELRRSSPVAPETEHPIWEHLVEEDVKVEGTAPRIDFRVFAKRFVGDHLIGSASIRLPTQVMDSPKRQELRLIRPSTICMPSCKSPPPAKLTVVWQVCDPAAHPLDLNRVAEMESSDMEKTSHSVTMKLLRFSMKYAIPQTKVGVTVRLMRLDKDDKRVTRSSPLVNTWPKAEDEYAMDRPATDMLRETKEASWGDHGHGLDLEPWLLHESRVTLMSWFLDISVSTYKEQGVLAAPSSKLQSMQRRLFHGRGDSDSNVQEIGSWREPLSDLLHAVDSAGHALRFDADLGPRAGLLSVELDVFKDRPHKSMVALAGDPMRTMAVPVRRGMPPESKWQDKVRYSCSVFADGLPMMAKCKPYVRITMGSSSVTTDVIDGASFNNIVWPQPVILDTKRFYRKASVEVFNCSGPSPHMESDLLLGESVIYDVSPDREYFVHFYGGAERAPNADIAMNMLRSAIRPASTYQGSVAIIFGSKRLSRIDFVDKVRAKRELHRLVVRLHKGVYLDRFKSRKVNVLCQVAGCRLPGAQEAQRLLRRRAFQAPSKSRGSTAEHLEGTFDPEECDPRRFNRNLLSFAGEVDENGLLTFIHEGKRCQWVELMTLREFPLQVPPNVSHVYLYVVPQGEEKEPPQVFGRLRLREVAPGAPNSYPPKWQRMRLDRSVVSGLPPAYFPSDLAGFVLGVAALIPYKEGHRAGNETATVTLNEELLPEAVPHNWCCSTGPCTPQAPAFLHVASKGEPVEARSEVEKPHRKETVYCYIDMLCARELPPMDPDGLMDPSYLIRVLDKEIIHPPGAHKTTSPTFMHRMAIPVEVELEEGPGPGYKLVASRTPVPPIIVQILDYDKSTSLFEKSNFETVGTVVIKHPQANGKNNQLVYKQLDYDEARAVQHINGEEYAIGPQPLDLNTMHTAYWYSLDAPGRMPFDSLAGGVDRSWQGRPRVLLAVGYSLQEAHNLPTRALMFGPRVNPEEDASVNIWQVECKDKACYQISIDLLGLRNLPPGLLNPKLYITSFWDGPKVEFDVTPDADHNFIQANGWGSDNLPEFASKMRPLLRLKAEDNTDVDGEDVTETVLFDELHGVRVRAPLYRIPVIPYLQNLLLHPGRWRMESKGDPQSVFFDLSWSSTRKEVEGRQVFTSGADPIEIIGGRIRGYIIEWRVGDSVWKGHLEKDGKRITNLSCNTEIPESPKGMQTKQYEGMFHQEDSRQDPFVLLPAITFELANAMTGNVYLTLTVGLNRLLLVAGGPHVRNWTELSLEEMAKLPMELKEWSAEAEAAKHKAKSLMGKTRGSIVPLPNTKVMEDAYMAFVDVFAARDGFLTWDDDFHLGRPLADQCLFSITAALDELDSEAKVDESAQPQYFNPGDWMFRGYDGPFDMRATPSLYCHSADVDGIRKMLGQATKAFDSIGTDTSSVLRSSTAERLRSAMKESLKRIEDVLNPRGNAKGKRDTKPKGPKELFQSVLGMVGGVKQEDLRQWTTHQIKEEMQKRGWRATSHLVAPEAEKLLPGKVLQEHLQANLHTFMRPVGHVISMRDRDSKLLCRLQMGLPLNALEDLRDRLQAAISGDVTEESVRVLLEEEKKWRTAGKATLNFLVIKFQLNGVVVWSAPEDNAYWGRPGTPLFAVRLADSPDVVVPVLVPSFDIRRRTETAWYPVKTLKDRFSTLMVKINRQRQGQQKASARKKWSKAQAMRQQMRECPAGGMDTAVVFHDPEVILTERDPDTSDNMQPDGYSRPIAVSKNAFICRIRRRMGGVAYDRPQTKNWYRTAMEEAFPELGNIQEDLDEEELCKGYILSRFMNIRQPLTVGLEQQSPALLKGHINCTRVQDPDTPELAGTRHLPPCTAPQQVDPLSRSVENLWISETVFIRVFVLSAHKLDVSPLGLAANLAFKPYICAQLGSDVQHGKPVEQFPAQVGNVNFYQKFVFQATMPGTAQMTLEIKHKGLMTDSSVGKVTLDLEDRLLALRRRGFRESSNEQFLLRNISPKGVCLFKKEVEAREPGWHEPFDPQHDPEYGITLKPHRGMPLPSPLESATLVRVDEEGEDLAGQLRFWIDMTPVGSHMPEDPEVFSNTEFEVRLSIFAVTNIKIFRDFGERNDVYVKSVFRALDYEQNLVAVTFNTDTHKFARSTANFNWNMSFNTAAPSSECSIEFTLMDADKFGDNDMIYYPKVYSLDHLLWLAYRNHRQGKPPVGALQDTIIFDRWPQVEQAMPRISCGCLRRIKRKLNLDSARFASMQIQVEILPKGEADTVPFQVGRFNEPRGRFSYVSALENPQATARMLLGPKKFFQIVGTAGSLLVFCIVLGLAALLLVILAIIKMF